MHRKVLKRTNKDRLFNERSSQISGAYLVSSVEWMCVKCHTIKFVDVDLVWVVLGRFLNPLLSALAFFPSGSVDRSNTGPPAVELRPYQFLPVIKMNLIFLGVVLTSLQISTGLEVRLVNGKHNYEGRIEVNYNGTWKAVCDHGWNRKAARVVCRMLGYPDVLRFTKGWVSVLYFLPNFGRLKMNHVSFIVKTVHSSPKVRAFTRRLAFLKYKILYTLKAYFGYYTIIQKGRINDINAKQ